jgi:hypothetical protein
MLRRKHYYISLWVDSFIALFGVFIFLAAGSKSMGQSVQVDQAALQQNQAPSPFGVSPQGTVGDHAVPAPNDSDIGEQQILKRSEKYDPFTFSIGTPIFYTSNVALTRSGEVGDVIEAPVAAIYYQPRITKTLYGLVDVRQQFFYYDTYTGFDFGSLDVEAGLSYFMPQLHNLILRGQYDFNRLTSSGSSFDEFYENHSIILSAELPFHFSRAEQAALGVSANISVAADHQAPRRNDYETYAIYSLHLTRALSIDTVGRVVVRDYYENDRTDLSEILSCTASYRLTNGWTVSAISSLANSSSNHSVFDYSVANVGGAVAFAAKF